MADDDTVRQRNIEDAFVALAEIVAGLRLGVPPDAPKVIGALENRVMNRLRPYVDIERVQRRL